MPSPRRAELAGRLAALCGLATGDLWLVGVFQQTVDFEGTKKTASAGSHDMFLLRMKP